MKQDSPEKDARKMKNSDVDGIDCMNSMATHRVIGWFLPPNVSNYRCAPNNVIFVIRHSLNERSTNVSSSGVYAKLK